MLKSINGFSKFSKAAKREWVAEEFLDGDEKSLALMERFDHRDETTQKLFDGLSENTVSNFHLPYGVAPNMVINGQTYCVPMVIEESSVVAAASAAAKFWSTRGGIHAKVIDTRKVGQVHFKWAGDPADITTRWVDIKKHLIGETDHLTANMRKRGGGILDIYWLDMRHLEEDYFQLKVEFETCDSMGANFINTVLEQLGRALTHLAQTHSAFHTSRDLTVIMAILSNYTPDCLVHAWVECPVEQLTGIPDLTPEQFAKKFEAAVNIACADPYRAVTHNKGIYNGIDAVVIATGNDFRAIEACGHAYAARTGQYRSLSTCQVENGIFKLRLEVPLAVGSVGGLTAVHPLAKLSLDILGHPSAADLMCIIVATGLAQNFAAVRSLVSTGIQKGHMKMHLHNILQTFHASDKEYEYAFIHFADQVVSFSAVREYLDEFRAKKTSYA